MNAFVFDQIKPFPSGVLPSVARMSIVQAASPFGGERGSSSREACASPLGGGGISQAQGGVTCSWDPTVFRPDVLVSCYSGEIFSGEKYQIHVSTKPGIGFQKPDCGSWVRKLQSGDEYRDIYHNCGSLGCPVCFEGELTDKAHDIEDRFDHYEQAKMREDAVLIPGEFRNVTPRQFVFTISPAHQAELIARVKRSFSGEWGEYHHGMFLDLVRDEYNRGLKLSGLLGGASFYHDARVQHPGTGLTGTRAKHLIGMEAKISGNMTDQDASWRIYDYIRQQKDWSKYYYFSPHFHVIAFGKVIEASQFEDFMPGWTYHNKGPVKNPGGLARYLMSHMAMVTDRRAISWFGRLSSRVLGKEELRTYEQPQVHPETGLPWMIIESVIPGEVGGQYHVTKTEYRGFFRMDHRRKATNPDVLKFPAGNKRSMAPSGVHEKGIQAMAKYYDEHGKL